MNFHPFLQKIKCFNATVENEYGRGLCAWIKFFYYSFFRLNTFYIYKASIENEQSSASDSGVIYHSPTFDELDKLRTGKDLPREFFCDQFHKVSQCFIAQVDGEIVYIHWIYHHGDFSRFLTLGKNSLEINYVSTITQFRGRGISATALRLSVKELNKQGGKDIFAVVHNKNIASIKSFGYAGFVEFGKVYSIGPFNRKIAV
jgi:L-amino acid N-acyltransferase YncA